MTIQKQKGGSVNRKALGGAALAGPLVMIALAAAHALAGCSAPLPPAAQSAWTMTPS
jgi:hypothetical protein